MIDMYAMKEEFSTFNENHFFFYNGWRYNSVECAYQAQKGGRSWYPEMSQMSAREAYYEGPSIVPALATWDMHRESILEDIYTEWLKVNIEGRKMLLASHPERLAIKNGHILMRIREKLLLEQEYRKEETMDYKNSFGLLVAGSRTFNDYTTMCSVLDYMLSNHKNEEIVIIEGGARGADSLAKKYAEERGYKVWEFKANWEKFGKSAGYRRNEVMHRRLFDFEKRGCVCFWDGESKGTSHNFGLAQKYSTPLKVWNFVTGGYQQVL